MLHQPRRWLPGLLPLALLAGGSLWWKQADIERDLSQRSREAIAAAGSTIDGKPWADITALGRDVVVTGDAPADGAGIGAAATALQQYGVRQAIADTDLIPAAEPFGWSARREGQTITLSGQVAPDGSRERLVAAARRAIPGGEVSDLMTVARGVPAGAVAAGALGIEQLGRVASGSATLAGNAFRFTGNAADATAQAAVTAALANLPQGIAAGAVNVAIPGAAPDQAPAPAAILPVAPTPPAPPPAPVPAPQAVAPAPAPVAPPPAPAPVPPPPAVADWSATRGQDGSLTLSGTVASEEARRRIIDAAMASTTGPVIDAMDVAEGLPANVEAKVVAALKQLEGLSTGTAKIAGTTFSFSGVAATPSAFDSLAAAIRNAGDGFSVGELIVAPPRIDPFTWSARKGEGAITLMGFAPSEAEKATVLAETSRIAGGLRVVDQMRVASGFPSGVEFGPLTSAALAQLGRLTEGSAQLIGNRLTLAGRAPDATTSMAVRQALADLRTPITAVSDLSLPAAEIPPPVETPPLSADLTPPPPRVETMAPPVADLPLPVVTPLAPAPATPAPAAAAPPAPSASPAPSSPASVPVPPSAAAPTATAAPPPVPAPVSQPRPDCSAIMQTALEGDRILFDYWKSEQRSEHAAVLDRLATALKRCAPDERIEVAGHADLHNRTNQNQKLSEDRATLMRDELVRRGVPAVMLLVVGYAETRPIAPSHSDESRALNRRVEFHVRPRG
jgi:outer membrane protein OmpA-like peptidoglycan-associated protein